MAVNWGKVEAQLSIYLLVKGIPVGLNLKAILEQLYLVERMSLQEIANLTFGEASSSSIRSKLKFFGIALRGVGGANYGKRPPSM